MRKGPAPHPDSALIESLQVGQSCKIANRWIAYTVGRRLGWKVRTEPLTTGNWRAERKT